MTGGASAAEVSSRARGSWFGAREREDVAASKSKETRPVLAFDSTEQFRIRNSSPFEQNCSLGEVNLNNRKRKITVGTRQRQLMETDKRCSADDLSLHMKDR